MEATVAYLLMLQKYIQSRKQYSSKQKTQEKRIMYCAYVMFQKIIQLKIRKKKQD